MQIVLILFLVIAIALVVFYFKQLENIETEYHNLECKLVDQKNEIRQLNNKIAKLEEENENAMNIAEKEVKKELYKLVFQNQHFNSVDNLQNKIKTILDDCNSSNIK